MTKEFGRGMVGLSMMVFGLSIATFFTTLI